MTSPTYIPDRPAESDALGRSHFAKSLAKALLFVSAGEGLVVGIEGGWGSGKSTIIGFVKKELPRCDAAELPPIVVDFNPWMVSNTGALVDALVTQIAAAINLDPSSPEKAINAGEKLLGYIGLLKHLKYLKYIPGIAFAGNIAEDVGAITGTVVDGTKDATDALGDLKKLLPTLDLAKKKADVIDALRDLDRPIVVIVDDVDRLPADEIRTVVQAIKAVADFPRTTYLLAYDRDVVAAALGNGNVDSGLSYLEKIVQVAYPIPPLFEYQLRNFVDKQVLHLLSSLGIELRDYEMSAYQKAIGYLARLARHPRDVVRLMNRLMLSLPATINEVNAVDVIVFEAFSQRFPKVRDSVHRHPADFTGGHYFRGDSGFESHDFDWAEWAALDSERKSDKPLWAKHLPQQESDYKLAKKVCAFLFPEGAGKRNRVAEANLHIADPDRLARYFLMTSLESVPEASDIHEKLSKPQELAEALATDEPSELGLLLEWICNYLPSSQNLNVDGSANALIERALRSESGLTADLANLFSKSLECLIRKAPAEKRESIFLQVVARSPLSISENVLLEAATDQGKWIMRPGMAKEADDQLISSSDVVNEAIATWSDNVRRSVVTGVLSEEPRMHAILHRFAQLNYTYGETYEVVGKICANDNGLRKFLSTHVKDSPFDSLDSYALVEDACLLADRIKASDLRGEYSWLADFIVEPGRAKAIGEQSARLKKMNLGLRGESP
ncbi:KAP family P-loop NTPase fold protein [Janthinobacterium sp. 1_2014MBL_MicDiv]|uniref:KAP family P-loop NTPase fold protein n=1 Tax=Janthinobacterium sp. 1_2014MBL_MicDiv TaxID=1644131 RepID=UPI0009F34275|nr:KAP family NTPase [Janthinobacterium sp. 1_2014MBL_MicDiv]